MSPLKTAASAGAAPHPIVRGVGVPAALPPDPGPLRFRPAAPAGPARR
ncbi:hypothetical protein SAMN05421773_109111 [Streptomyces aidingensis]|uniref:Uncharacterized protein n=1 Tax=Streptomyces aidingensis TaxID=910347 RepID=A0A1I1PDG9_9ACTN|nr:hypothetical protein SAMN05421773_109111 [Streptomyces aidingensis]